jgi:anti-anti-sigma regulatory factor
MVTITKSPQGIIIYGNIRSTDDVNKIKESLSSQLLKNGASITIDIKDSFAMPSAMIGFLMKLVEQNQVTLTLHIADERLVELLDDLGLSTTFHIKSTSVA